MRQRKCKLLYTVLYCTHTVARGTEWQFQGARGICIILHAPALRNREISLDRCGKCVADGALSADAGWGPCYRRKRRWALDSETRAGTVIEIRAITVIIIIMQKKPTFAPKTLQTADTVTVVFVCYCSNLPCESKPLSRSTWWSSRRSLIAFCFNSTGQFAEGGESDKSKQMQYADIWPGFVEGATEHVWLASN